MLGSLSVFNLKLGLRNIFGQHLRSRISNLSKNSNFSPKCRNLTKNHIYSLKHDFTN